MARSATEQTTAYTGTVLQDGHLSLPKSVQQKLRLRQGDTIHVVLHSDEISPVEPERELPESVRALVEELVGRQADREQTVAALVKVALQMPPSKKQRRLSHLLWKNQVGNITRDEEEELDALVAEGEEGTIRKAKAIWALRQLGVDVIPELEARLERK